MFSLDSTELARPVPLTTETDGSTRIAGTRVTLDTLVAAFREGATAEEIAQQYPSLALADVYAVLGYYLREQPKVDDYLRQRQGQSQRVQQENEARFDPRGVRARLMARRGQG